jgi:hypothetical protein
MRYSFFIWATSLLADFVRIHSNKLRGFFTPETYTGVLLRCSPGGTTFSTWAVEEVVLISVPPIGPDTSPGAPGEVRLCVASFEATGTDREPVPLAVSLGGPLGLLSAVG